MISDELGPAEMPAFFLGKTRLLRVTNAGDQFMLTLQQFVLNPHPNSKNFGYTVFGHLTSNDNIIVRRALAERHVERSRNVTFKIVLRLRSTQAFRFPITNL